MKRWYGVAALMLAMAAPAARAQMTVQSIEEIRFSSDNSADGVQRLGFGFGSEYSDSMDFDMGEQIIPPFFPPDGFFVFLTVPDNMGSEDFAVKDIRGVPDSVQSGVANNFSLVYNMRVKRGTGQQVTISFPVQLRAGIDSINVTTPQAGANFSHTFMREGGQVTINPLITRIRMTVYYNYNRVASAPLADRGESREIALYPNQLRPGGTLNLAGELPAGARLVIADISGSVVAEENFSEARQGAQVTVPSLPAGMYVVRLLGAGGEMLRHGRFTVAR